MIWGRDSIVVGHSWAMAKNSDIQGLNAWERPESCLDAGTVFSRPKEKPNILTTYHASRIKSINMNIIEALCIVFARKA